MATWFLAGALYFGQRIRRDLVDPFTRLRTLSGLQAGMGAARENLLNATLQGGPSGRERLEKAAGILSDLGRQSSQLPLQSQEREAVETAVRLQQEMAEHARAYLSRANHPAGEDADLAEVRRLSLEITQRLHAVALNNQRDWKADDAQLRKDTWRLYFVLGGFGLISVFALVVFRRVHRRDIWGPLEELRQMVLQVRRGNLSHRVRTKAIDELATLVRAFNEMMQALEGNSRELESRRRFTVIARAQRVADLRHDLGRQLRGTPTHIALHAASSSAPGPGSMPAERA